MKSVQEESPNKGQIVELCVGTGFLGIIAGAFIVLFAVVFNAFRVTASDAFLCKITIVLAVVFTIAFVASVFLHLMEVSDKVKKLGRMRHVLLRSARPHQS